MRANPVDLIGGFYADDSLPWADQDTLNWLPVRAEVEGTLTPVRFATPPGLKPYQQIGSGPIRGMHDLEGERFVVSGRMLYRINGDGIGIPVGAIPGVGRVSMTHNQFKTGYQLLVENGQGGGGYVYDSSTKGFYRITDEGYPGSISSDYLDSYLLGVEPQGRYWFHSNLADATDYNTLDRYESEASPDKIVGLAVSQLEVVVFNQRTIEFFYNAGGATGTFQNRRQSITRGCASRHTIAKLDNTLFWLGDDGIVYRLEGYSARPISTGPMHRAFAGKNWAEAFAYVWEDRGFKVYYLTFPDGRTWGYDVVSGLWTRRGSYGLDRWRLTHTVKWGNQWFGGDFQSGRVWELNWDYYLEGDQEFISERTSPCMHDNQSNLGIPFAELVFDTGSGPMTEAIAFPSQPSTPMVTGAAPDGFLGYPYTYTYAATGGTGALTYSVRSYDGTALVGVTINPATGEATFSAAASGLQRVYVRATDTLGIWGELLDSVQIVNRNPLPNLVATFAGTRSVSALQYSVVAQALTEQAFVTIPGGGSNGKSNAIGEVYIATHSITPFLRAYKRAGSVMTALPAASPAIPAVGETVAVYGDVSFIAHSGSPFIAAYSINQTTGFGTKFAAPSVAVPGAINDIAVHPSGQYVAIACSASPYIISYRWNSSTGFGERLPNPATGLTAAATGISFNESGTHLAVSSGGTITVRVYRWEDGFGAIVSTATPIASWSSNSIAISDAAGLLIGGSESGVLRGFAYKWSAEAGIGELVPIPAGTIVGIARSVAISQDGYLLAFGTTDNSGFSICEWDKQAGVIGTAKKFGTTACRSIKFKE